MIVVIMAGIIILAAVPVLLISGAREERKVRQAYARCGMQHYWRTHGTPMERARWRETERQNFRTGDIE